MAQVTSLAQTPASAPRCGRRAPGDVKDPYLPKDGYLELRPDRPGWGAEMDEQLLGTEALHPLGAQSAHQARWRQCLCLRYCPAMCC